MPGTKRRARRRSAAGETVALVFCGGEGRRLRPITFLMNKGMLPVGPQRKPVLEYVVGHLRQHGLRRILLVGCDAHGAIGNYFGDGARFGVHIEYQRDPAGCKGTGHALLHAIRRKGLSRDELLVYYGDILNMIDLGELMKEHRRFDAAATIVLTKDYRLRIGLARVRRNGRVESFAEKPPLSSPNHHVNVGVMCVNCARLLRACGRSATTAPRFKNVTADILPRLVREEDVYSYVTAAPWIDVGTFENYAQIDQELKREAWKGIRGYITPVPTRETRPFPLTVFLSYRIDRDSDLIQGLVKPTLECLGVKVVDGGEIDDSPGAGKLGAGQLVDAAIENADLVIAFASGGPGEDPPGNVVDEVRHARNVSDVCVFVEREVKVPSNWHSLFVYKQFDRSGSGPLLRDVVRTVTKKRKQLSRKGASLR